MGNSKKELLVVYRDMPSVTLRKPVNVLLPPQFYTMKKESLSIKYTYQARKIAPAIFEGLLEERETYRYFVYAEGEHWVFIAYDPEEIKHFFQNKGIAAEMVSGIYFAQQCAGTLTKPLLLGEKEVLTVLDGTVVIVPRTAVDTEDFISPSSCTLPKRAIAFDAGSNGFLHIKQALLIAFVLFVFGTVWYIEAWRYTRTNDTLERELSVIFKRNPSMQNVYTRDNIAQKYQTIDQRERKKRHAVSQVSHFIFKGVTLVEMHIRQKHFQAVFDVSDNGVAKRLKSLIKQAGYVAKESNQGKQVMMEGTL